MPVILKDVCSWGINEFLSSIRSPPRGRAKLFMVLQRYRPHDQFVAVRIMGKDISGIIRSLQTSAVTRCRDRIKEAALRRRGLNGHENDETVIESSENESGHGVTEVLKRRHGL